MQNANPTSAVQYLTRQCAASVSDGYGKLIHLLHLYKHGELLQQPLYPNAVVDFTLKMPFAEAFTEAKQYI